MNAADILVIIIVAIALFFAARACIKRAKNKSCCTGCGDCGSCGGVCRKSGENAITKH